MTSWRAAACALALLCGASGCATRAPHPDAFAFGVVGDTPYGEREEAPWLAMIDRINREPLAFTLHVGDFKGGGACSDALYARRRSQFDRFTAPLVYTPGDNEWTDCRGKGVDPIERLARLREVFFADRHSLGAQRLELSMQEDCVLAAAGGCACPALPENRFWSRAGVRFVTLNVPGSDNGLGRDRAGDDEARCRDQANAQWLERAVRASERSETRALVVAFQANPLETRKPVYAPLLRQLAEAARRLKKPLLVVHGDTHTQRVDQPFRDSFGNPLPGMSRLETYGSPFVGWVKVTVDPADPEVFSFEPRLEAFVPPR